MTVVKTLFANSCNICAFPRCEERLTHPKWKQVNAEMAHIEGERAGSPRYNPDMMDEQRRGYDNLILLCPNHHRMIDYLTPDEYPTQVLMDIKAKHENGCSDRKWAPASDLALFAALLLALERQSPTALGRPELVIQKGSRDDQVEVVNRGNGDAIAIRPEPYDEETANVFVSTGDAPPRISPGGSWTAGLYGPSLADRGPHVIRLRWRGSDGSEYEGEFPL